jgi:hypothetical protein
MTSEAWKTVGYGKAGFYIRRRFNMRYAEICAYQPTLTEQLTLETQLDERAVQLLRDGRRL